MPSTLEYCIYVSVFVFAALILNKRRKSTLPYPPGPKGLPLIGNVFDLPPDYEWLTYTRWAREMNSDVIRLNVLGKNVLIVNTYEAANELFEKRAAIYSDRPRQPMLVELAKWDHAFMFFDYGTEWKSHRKLFHQYYSPSAVMDFREQELSVTSELLRNLVKAPENFMHDIHLWGASLVLMLTYGIKAHSMDDPFIVNAEKSLAAVGELGNPGAFLVDAFPILKYVPSWMPGAGFQTKARVWRRYITDLVDQPLKYVKDEMEKGTAYPSIVSRMIESMEEEYDAPTAEEIRGVGGQSYLAGADTTISAVRTCILAMVLHPEILQKAQEQLDSVLGGDRLPNFSDKDSLPYIEAIVKECLRWHQVAPTGGVPHKLSTDDVYNGMFMPAGSTVVGNSWAILHDTKEYGPDVDEFNPERFLKDGEQNPNVRYPDAAFGFGRRICPGRYLAADSMFIVIASILASFDITNAVDEKGNPIVPNAEYTSGLVIQPKDFQCSIKPRSQRALDLITESGATFSA